MQDVERIANDWRILVLAPTGQDAALSVGFLQRAGFHAEACDSLEDLIGRLRVGCAALLMAEEALEPRTIQVLNCVLE